MIKLYNPDTCPCSHIHCPRYKDCEPCIEFHHNSEEYPLTACEQVAEREKRQARRQERRLFHGKAASKTDLRRPR